MAIQMGSLTVIALTALCICFKISATEKPQNPAFEFSWWDEKDTFKAGETATVKIKVSNHFEKLDKTKFRPIISVNGKIGNSSYVTDVLTDLGGDSGDNWKIYFTTLASGLFNLMITEENYGVLDSSLHFQVEPGEMNPSVSVASWMGFANEFEAGSKATIGVLPKDAFGNNVTSTIGDPGLINFTLTAVYSNGSISEFANVTRVAWNGFGFISVEFVVVRSGHFFLLVKAGNQTLSGSNILSYKVNPGSIEVLNCMAKSRYEPNVWQLFSKMELFIYQRDRYGNLVTAGLYYDFDAEVIERETNMSIPIPDLYFKEAGPGIQQLAFLNLEPGNFSLLISNLKHNKTISDMPFYYTVFVGYCNGSTSVVNGSGLNNSVAGESAEFSVYLRDSYQYPSLVQPERLRVQIVHEIDSYNVIPKINPLQTMNDTELYTEIAPSPNADQSNHSVANSTVLAADFNVIYTPEKSGIYRIRVFCGNIFLNEEHSFTKEVSPGMVDVSLSGVVKFEPKVPKQTNNEVIVQLVDSFYNPILSQQSRLKLEVSSSKNTSGFSTGTFVDNNDGSYSGYYVADDIGTYEVFALFDGNHLSPTSFEVNVYPSEYFPKAIEDRILVWEDESIAFNALANDYFAGENASIIEFSDPSHGSLLKYGALFRYTPHKDYYGNDSFAYTISDINGNLASSSVNISVLPIPPQFISFPTKLKGTEDKISPRFGGFSGFELRFSDMAENISVNVSAQSGTIYFSPMAMQFWPIKTRLSVHKTESKSLVLEGNVEVVNFALKSIQYLGNENFFGTDTLRLSTRSANGVNNLDVPLYLDPINDPPFIHVPEFIILKSNEDKSMIYNPKIDKFEFHIGDPDLHGFPDGDSLFTVIFSVELDNGYLSTSLPSELINTTEFRTTNNYQWQPLQTYVTISQHFTVKANGIKFRGTVNDCNAVMKQLFYHGKDHGSVLTLTVNDMGNYGCYPDCDEGMSMPLYTESTVNLIRRRPRSSFVSRAIGSTIVIESIIVLSLGVVLLSFTCKCAFMFVRQRRTRTRAKNNSNISEGSASKQRAT